MFFQNQLPLIANVMIVTSCVILLVKYFQQWFHVNKLKSDLKDCEIMLIHRQSEIVTLEQKIFNIIETDLKSYKESTRNLKELIEIKDVILLSKIETLDKINKLIEKDRLKRKSFSEISIKSETEFDDKKRKQLKSAITVLRKLMSNKVSNVNELAFLVEINMLIKNYEEDTIFSDCFFFELNEIVSPTLQIPSVEDVVKYQRSFLSKSTDKLLIGVEKLPNR